MADRNEQRHRPAAGKPRGRWRHLPVLPPALVTALVATTAVVAALTDPKIPEASGD
jgi:hypothetical protein